MDWVKLTRPASPHTCLTYEGNRVLHWSREAGMNMMIGGRKERRRRGI